MASSLPSRTQATSTTAATMFAATAAIAGPANQSVEKSYERARVAARAFEAIASSALDNGGRSPPGPADTMRM